MGNVTGRLRRAVAGATVALVLASALGPTGTVLAAEPSWLDQPLQGWNGPASGIPDAPQALNTNTGAVIPPQAICLREERGPVVEVEKQVAARGWRLENYWQPRQAGDVTVVTATAQYDGMCRPMAYQAFAFVGTRFAGTLSPEPMRSRFDGMLDGPPEVLAGAVIQATYTRYDDRDPLCCPSLPKSRVRFELAGLQNAGMFTPTAVTRLPLPAPSPAPAPGTPSQLPNTGDAPGALPWLAAAAGLVLTLGGRVLRRPTPQTIRNNA